MDDKSIFVTVLNHGAELGLEGTTYDNFFDWALRKNLIKVKQGALYSQLDKLFHECFITTSTRHLSDDLYVLRTEYFTQLIEFRMLEDSRKASSDANIHSKVAIGFSIVAMTASLVIGVIQLNSTVTINYDQVNRMETKEVPISQNIESEQLTQVIEALKQSNINTAELTRMIREQNKQVGSGEVKGK